MAGLGTLDAMYQTFLGQTNDAMNQPAAPWQQELMETVNPQKVRAQNIKRALAQASMALATTPGNFLTGLSAAAGTGANAYLTAQDDSEQQRMKAMQLVQMAQQKDKDRRLALLHDALGVGRNLQSDEIAAEDRKYNRNKDAKAEARQKRLDDSLIAYRERPRGGGTSGELTQNQIGIFKRDIRRQLRDERKRLEEEAKGDESITPEAIEQQLDEYRIELEDYYGISTDDGAPATTQNVTQFDLMTGGAQSALPGAPPQAASLTQGATPPQQAVEALRENPNLKAQFDAKYGQGAADRYLGN